MSAEFCHLELKLLLLWKRTRVQRRATEDQTFPSAVGRARRRLVWGMVPSGFASSPDISIFFGSSLAIAGANWWWCHWYLQPLPALWVLRPQHVWASKAAAESVSPKLAHCFHQKCSWQVWHYQLFKCPSLAVCAQSPAFQLVTGLSFLSATLALCLWLYPFLRGMPVVIT